MHTPLTEILKNPMGARNYPHIHSHPVSRAITGKQPHPDLAVGLCGLRINYRTRLNNQPHPGLPGLMGTSKNRRERQQCGSRSAAVQRAAGFSTCPCHSKGKIEFLYLVIQWHAAE
jgi:hypothetical protein